MKFDIVKRMEVVDRTIDETTNRLHKAILENYRRHATLEVTGLWEQILIPEMTVEHPLYKIHNFDKLIVADGMDAVRKIYRRMAENQSTVIYHTDEFIMVSDDGLMTQYVSHRFWPGDKLAALEGKDIYGKDSHYIVSQTLINFFTYNENGILTGEIVYHGADRSVRLCAPEELITLEEARERLLPGLRPVESFALWAN
ncbi:hypothetical protein [Paraburkholderia sp. D1E]|uniref:hypothetical protein n=1 Tax=Paraburkholderia sp. D1E TaxID=3461398 RepID=UPI004045E63C